MTAYKVIIEAHPREGFESREVRAGLAALFKTSTDMMENFLAGHAMIIKSRTSLEEAEKYREAIEKTGAICRLQKIEEAHALVNATMEPVRCPKCAYQAQTEDDPLITGGNGLGECPRCGIIVKKYLERQKQLTENAPGHEAPPVPEPETATADEMTAGNSDFPSRELPAAGLKIRAEAGLYTIAKGLILYIGIWLPILTVLILTLNWKIHLGNKNELMDMLHFFSGVEKAGTAILFIGVVVYALIVLPSQQGQTWGQSQFGLRVVDHENKSEKTSRALLLRFLAHALAYFTVGLALLIPYFRQDRKPLPDLLSGTRTVEEPETIPGSGKTVFILAVCLMVVFQCARFGMISWTESTAKHKLFPQGLTAAEKKAHREQQLAMERARDEMMVGFLMKRCEQGDEAACEGLPGRK